MLFTILSIIISIITVVANIVLSRRFNKHCDELNKSIEEYFKD